MTDRELLEMAAKADNAGNASWNNADYQRGFLERWNPLTDDGDALRLAVKLRIDVEHMAMEVFAAKGPKLCMVEPNDDPYAATRRAIVRAAAAIGKDMP